MVNALLLMVTTGQQSDPLAKTLPEFTVVAETVSEAAKKLGEQAAITLNVPGKLGKEIVFASIKNKTAKQCMDRLAEVSYGEWKFENGVYTLTRNQSAQTAESQAISAQTEILRKQLKDKAAELKQPVWSRAAASKYVEDLHKLQKSMQGNFRVEEGERAQVEVQGPSTAGPAYDLLSTVIGSLDPTELQNIPTGGRVVLSTNPNRVQRPLRMNISGAVQQYTQRMDQVFEAVQSSNLSDLGADFSGSVGFPKSKSLPVAKVNVILHSGAGGYTIGVQLIGANGEEIAMTSSNLVPGTEFDPSEEPALPPEPAGEQIKLSPMSTEFLSMVAGFGLVGGSTRSIGVMIDGAPTFVTAGQAARPINPSPALNSIFANPVKNDPLLLVVPEVLDHIYKSKDYVAVFPDAIWTELWNGQSQTVSVGGAKEALISLCEISEEDDRTTIRPRRPILAENTRINRQAMETLVGQVNNRGFARLTELAEYATSRGSYSSGQSLDMLILGIAVPFAAQDIRGGFGFNYWLAPIIASKKRDIDTLPDGEFLLPYSFMNSQEKIALERLIYDEPLDASIASGNFSINVGTEPRNTVLMAKDSEPTELFPNGLPSDVAVKLTAKSQEGVLGKLKKSRNGRLMSATQLGAILGLIDGEGGAEGEMKITAYEEFQLATIKEIRTTVMKGTTDDRIRGGQGFVDGVLLQGGPLGLNQLPESMIGKIESARKQLRDMMQRMNQQGGGRTVPPPAQ